MRAFTALAYGVLTIFSAAQASTATATLAITATVLSYCTISAVPLPFGNYASATLAATSTVSVTCTLGTTYNVGLDVGGGTGATVAARKMSFLTNTLSYGLFSDPQHTVPWGPTIGTNTVAGTGNGSATALIVYGQIPAGQFVSPGAYVDTVTATITY